MKGRALNLNLAVNCLLKVVQVNPSKKNPQENIPRQTNNLPVTLWQKKQQQRQLFHSKIDFLCVCVCITKLKPSGKSFI